jgi:NAD+ synthase
MTSLKHNNSFTFDRHALKIDAGREADRICAQMRQTVRKTMRRFGAVVGVSGGVDSSVVLALCARAFGPDRVRALIMPERDSDPESERLARASAGRFGVPAVVENISACLEGLQCYRRIDDAIRRLLPEYDAARGFRSKITLPPNLLEEGTLNVFSLTVLRPDGEAVTRPLPLTEFLQIVAASNLKQRARMTTLYYHAELNHYAVIGTANKNEHELGFFVKYGDGGVDIQPIAHLYKTQVYQLAEFLNVTEEIRRRVPTTDTYSAPTSQEEFFFRLPFETLDLLWFAMENHVPTCQVARTLGLSEDQVNRVFDDLRRKQRTTQYLRLAPVCLHDTPDLAWPAVN